MAEQKRKALTDEVPAGLHAVPMMRRPDDTTRSMLEGLATLHLLVVAIDADHRVSWLKDDLDILTDSKAGELVGQPLAELLLSFHRDNLDVLQPQALEFVDDMKRNGRVTRARFDLHGHGSDRSKGLERESLSLEVSAFSIRDARGEPAFICVADRRRPSTSLEKKNDELEACVRGISHDLRSPLVSVLGFARLLRDDYAEILDQKGLHFLDRVDMGARHMEQLLQDLLELSRIGDTSSCRVHVHPTPVLEQLKSELKWQLDEKNIALELPQSPPTILFDRTRLYQVFSNLITNAIHHMGSNASPRIEVGVETVSGGWQISVHDNGQGIPKQDQVRIFDAFESLGAANAGQKNSGLGLAIVRKIVETESGRIWVESAPDDGARFIVWLPAG